MGRGILLDLDGTLTDTRTMMATAIARAMQAAGHQPLDAAELAKRVCNETPMAILRSTSTPLYLYWAAYEANVAMCRLSDDRLLAALDSGRTAGLRFGVVTSLPSGAAHALLGHLGLRKMLTSIVTYGRTRNRKPHPDPIRLAVSELDVAADQSIYIGDQPEDILAGKRAGVKTAAALWGFGEKAALLMCNPDLMLAQPWDLIRVIEIIASDVNLENSASGTQPKNPQTS